MNDATDKSHRIGEMENSIQSYYRRFAFFAHLITLSACASKIDKRGLLGRDVIQATEIGNQVCTPLCQRLAKRGSLIYRPAT